MKRTLAGTLMLLASTLALFAQALDEPQLAIRTLPGNQVQIAWPSSLSGFIVEASDSLSADAVWSAAFPAPTQTATEFVVTIPPARERLFLRLHQQGGPPTTYIRSVSPLDGETGVAVTRETILDFSAPLAPNTVISSNAFYATFGERRILSRIELSRDRTRASLFYLEPLPGSARIVVVFDGNLVLDQNGVAIDADDDDIPGGEGVFAFDTLSLSPLGTTAVIGTVYAAEPVAGTGANTNKPLAGVTISVDGKEQEIRAVTDANGNFKLSPVPPGRFFVHIDGRTVADQNAGLHYPDKSYYPFVGKAWDAIAGRDDNQAGGTGKIYLPLIVGGTLQPVSLTSDTVVSFPNSVVSANPALAGVSVTVPANSLFNDNGTRGGKVGIAPVPPDRLPGPLPDGVNPPIVITVQTDGALNFDRPAAICFPNLPDPVLGTPLPAGSKQALISFNHKRGIWEPVASMTVSADGKLIYTDPGQGIQQPGWHGVAPPPISPPPPKGESCAAGGGSTLASLQRQDTRRRKPNCDCKFDQKKLSACRTVVEMRLRACIRKATADLEAAYAACDDCDPFKNAHPCGSPEWEKVNYRCREKAHQQGIRARADCSTKNLSDHQQCADCFGDGSAALFASAAVPATVADQIIELVRQMDELIASSDHGQLSPAAQDQFNTLRTQANSLAGGDAVAFLDREVNEIIRELGEEPGDYEAGNAPAYPVFYAATIYRKGGPLILRGQTGPFGQYSLFIPRDGELYDVSFYDPRTHRYAIITPNRFSSSYALPRFNLNPLLGVEADADGDALPDIVEDVYGTDPVIADTDNDGIPDGAEIEQGTNPLNGFVTQTGVVGTVKTPGIALDITTGNDRAITAEGPAGISILDISDPLTPKLLTHLDTPGTAQRVAASGNFVAVADGNAGLAIIDMADPALAIITQQLHFGTVQSVVAAGGIAYAGLSSGQVISVELGNGLVLDSLQVGTDPIQDLALEGEYLYALTANRLIVISSMDALAVTGSATSPFPAAPNQRLFVGGGIAYTTHGKGYNTLDLADPAKPLLLTTGNTTQLGWRQIVANGSGLGVAVVGPILSDGSDRNTSLYDLSNPKTNNIFLTTLLTPGNSRAVSIYNGLAYVADDSAGVQVLNYLPYDNKRLAPSITLTVLPSFTEGNLARLTAQVTDDVQVRNVEFYVDGAKAFTDGSFPFEYRFVAPLRSSTKTSIVVRARAFDTGGNFAWSAETTVPLTPDVTPPHIVQVDPFTGGKAVTTLLAAFNEPLDASTLNPGSVQIFSLGPDGLPATADDIAIGGGVVSYNPDTRLASLSFAHPLPDGFYRAVITTAVTDIAHNHLAADYQWQFRVADATFWNKASSGDWSDPLNWSSHAVPGPNDNVVIDVPSAEITVTLSARTNFFKNLTANETLLAASTMIQNGGEIRVSKSMTLDRSTIKGGTITTRDGAKLLCVNNIPSTLDGVTLNGDLDVTAPLARIFIRNGINLNGTVFIDRGGNVTFPGTQSLSSGTIICGGLNTSFYGNSLTVPDNNTALTLGANVVLRGNILSIGGNGALVNQGLISADGGSGPLSIATKSYTNSGTNDCRNSGVLSISSSTWTNTGLIRATGSGSVSLNNSWSNAGILEMTDSTINLGGTFTVPQLGTLRRSGGTVRLGGVLNLTGDTLALNGATGSWIMDRGTIKGGTVTQSDGAKLICVNNIPSYLDGVSIQGDLDVTSQLARVFIRNGLTITGAVLIDRGGNLTFSGNQAFGGTINFGGLVGGGQFQNSITIDNNTTLTFSSTAVFHGKSININGPGTLINQGMISSDASAGSLTIAPARFTNEATSECRNGGSLTITSANWTNTGTLDASGGGTLAFQDAWSNNGTINIDAAILDLAGTFTPAQLGVLKRRNGTIKVSGTLNLTGATLDLNATTGSWQLERGSILGGTVTLSGGARLSVIGNIPSTLDGVTIDGDLDVNSTLARVIIRHSLSMTGNVLIDRAGNLTFDGPQTFSTGSIIFGSLQASFFSNTVTINNGTILTIGPAATLRGHTAVISGQGSIVNQGLISCDVAGGNFRIDVGQFTNTGTVQEKNGGKVVIVP